MSILLYGKKYDITDFINKHPGGPNIFKNIEEDDDLTALYNTYHFKKSKTNLDLNIQRYLKLIDSSDYTRFSFHRNGFYNTVRDRVFFKIGIHNKANSQWFVKVFFTLILIASLPFLKLNDTILGFIFGLCIISLAFNVLHDSSHYAISKNYKINEFISKVIQCLVLWNHYLWFRHHVYAHHSFTGDTKMDPDVSNYKPFIRKHIGKHVKYEFNNQEKYALPFMGFIPGQYLGQVIQYIYFSFGNHMWQTKINKNKKYSNIYERILYYISIILNIYYIYNKPVFMLSYYLTSNFFYFICIAPDHDTYESNILNHNSNTNDWGEIQVRRSANFGTKYPIVCFLFGGINYQIEHHLFPDVCHVHYSEISKIVKQTCKEFHIPYVELSWYDAIISCLKTYKYYGKM